MIRYFLVAGFLISGAAMAAPAYDIRSNPAGAAGNAPTHVDGNDAGRPIIHRPEAQPSNSVSNGLARQGAGVSETERSITYSGPGRGSLGSTTSPSIVTNDDGRPQLIYPN